MDKRLYSGTGLIVLALVFLVFAALNDRLFSGARLDLTESSLYTLSDGSVEVVEAVDEPINLYFFFSEKASTDLTGLRAYARRVQSLLEEYATIGGGSINLAVIDPEPFSEDEDRAALFGLQSVPVNAAGDELYFGLAGSNAVDDSAIIPFFQPDREEFLEYEISKLIQELSVTAKPVMGVLSSLPVRGDVNMQTFETTQPWVSLSQLDTLFDVQTVETTAESLPEELDLLVLIHPRDLSADLRYAIDQFVMGGGRLIAFVDPLAEIDGNRPSTMNFSAPSGQASDVNWLTTGWGVSMPATRVIGDSQFALQVATAEGRPVRHLAIVGLTDAGIAREDVVTTQLESINLATPGYFTIAEDAAVSVSRLFESSEFAMPMDAMRFQFLSDPSELLADFEPDGNIYPLAVRLQGAAESAFPDRAGDEGHIASSDNVSVVLVADVDMLADRLWVQVQSFFGQQIASPFADNGDFLINAVDNLAGSASLIGIRSRGRFTRPFDVVQDIRREAEASYLESADDLQAQLMETERQLSELQAGVDSEGLLSLTPAQEEALDRFQGEKLRIRKELRDVRHQMDREIESLGAWLKFLNVALVPLLLTLALYLVNLVRSRA